MSKEELSKLVASRNFTVRLKVETGGRKGKTVTVLDGLPKNELFLKALVKMLKQKCGAGGGHSMAGKDGLIELQGDHRERVQAFLIEMDMKVKA